MIAVLIEPHAGGRASGGYLYNARMVAGSSGIERRAVDPARLEAELDALDLPEGVWLIADSLFLNRAHMGMFAGEARRREQRLGVLLHSFPSFIRRGEDRDALARSLPLAPSAEEIELLDAVDLLIAPGPYVPQVLAECGCRVRTAICEPGVDPPPQAPAPARTGSAEPIRICSIGAVTPLKGLLDAADALALLPAANFRWTIIGHLGVAPDHVRRLQQRVRDLGLGDRVEYAGQQSHTETLEALRGSDLLLITSHTENHPLVALEALAAGVPTVGYRVGGLPDIIQHGETGLLAPLLDISALSEHLRRLCADAAERQRLSNGCARAAALLPTWPEAARRFARVFELHSS